LTLWKTHPREDLLRYLDGEVGDDEKRILEEHLASCKECRDYISMVKGFNRDLASLTEEEFASQEPCPDSWTLVSYEAGKVDEETARHLRTHLLFCDECAEEFYALRRLSREESWQELVERLKEFVVDLGKTYGPQALVGSIRILAEQPAFAVRGGGLPKAVTKVLEVSVGENTYSIEVAMTEDDLASCDIAGSRTSQKVPLSISVHSETGDELVSAQSDEFGNSRFVVPSTPDHLLVFTLKLGDAAQSFVLRVPEKQMLT
jgi:Putative zinc-finger